MTYNTPNLQLVSYDLASDGSVLTSQYINDVSGSTITSNMMKLDTFAAGVTASMIEVTASAVILSASVITAGSYTQVLINDRGQIISASVTPARNGNLWLGAAGMIPSTASPCYSLRKMEFPTNQNNIYVMDFSGSLTMYCEQWFRMPDDWDGNAISASFTWLSASIAVGTGVVWGIMGNTYIDGQDLSATHLSRFGTSASWAEAPDVATSACAIMTTPSTPITGSVVRFSSIRASGSGAAGDIGHVIIRRSASAVDDTSDVNASLIGVTLTYGRKL